MSRTSPAPSGSFLDAIRIALDADLVLFLDAVSPDRMRVLARSGAADHVPDEVLAPEGSTLARVLAGRNPGRLQRLPLLAGASGPARPLGPALVVPVTRAGAVEGVLVVTRQRPKGAFDATDLERVRGLATVDEDGAAPVFTLEALGGDATFRAAFEAAAVGMSLVDATLRYRWVNAPLCAMLGRGRDELVGLAAVETVHPDHLERAVSFFERLLRGAAGAARDRLRFQRPDGSPVWAEVGGSIVAGSAKPPLLLVQHFDVTEEHRAAEENAFLAMHDELTGLANRTLLRDRLQAVLARARRKAPQGVAFYLDVDDFKSINDQHGHAAGDRVLVETARRLTEVVRAGDTVARVGGDEFVVAGEATGIAEASHMAHRIGVALRPEIDLGPVRLPFSVSIGLALSQPDDEPEDLIDRADQALLKAKRLRRLRVVAGKPG